MARYTASILFSDGDQLQTVARGTSTYPDELAQLRHEAVQGMRELLAVTRMIDDPEVTDALDALDRMDDE